MKTISALYSYPIKGLAGISLEEAPLGPRGLLHDRRWMLTDMKGNFLSQRKLPGMALIQVAFSKDGLMVSHRKFQGEPLTVPLPAMEEKGLAPVKIWEDVCGALTYPDHINSWFSDMLGTFCRLAYLPDFSVRPLPDRYGKAGEQVGFADSCPLLIAGEASLLDLNSHLPEPVPMSRFRPNIVFTGGTAFEEDHWGEFHIRNASLRGIRKCARCQVVNIDQDTAYKYKEPLATLSQYRQEGNAVYFGLHATLLPGQQGDFTLRVGDEISLL
ncbi:MOSC domain-containing protein [Phaeodactylibacter luteus]|uniref:MOSC domain-containing protein n=1 Tax=Phaeodactylibacter luteus TaxID=1564516 RepID=A0A5C6RR54_9BACT|nr:MOSC N-terminal beta barrel domain-containing protein [Phaeodactylibacter luteus]TXB64886.1 MOSC domain-containing protein [Phaeodactylibacter luteus]